ncbi:10245_t:CDS:2 [Entrophospora sp. SA101]|nr:13392_t:CDS:2 [Entrophospora sp. SA101]CAJ0745524.1 19346_t:CDS:2 [Entrophospora sp. SA101]CAJ0768729.1 10245_t:CDS:2 [Entrophospora sp. SA101]
MSVVLCKWFTVVVFTSISLAILVVLSVGVRNDKPTIKTLILQWNTRLTICLEYITQPIHYNNNIWEGGFSPANLSFSSSSQYQEIILFITITDPSYNYTVYFNTVAINMHDSEYLPFDDPYKNTSNSVYSAFNTAIEHRNEHGLGVTKMRSRLLYINITGSTYLLYDKTCF